MNEHREVIAGTSKNFVDLSVTYSRYGGPDVQAPPPFVDHASWLKATLNDDTAGFVKAWANLMWTSIRDNRQQVTGGGTGQGWRPMRTEAPTLPRRQPHFSPS